MTTAAPAWRMKFYPQWPELREMMAEKYAEAGVGKGIFYYVISMFPENENLAMRKALERRSNYNGDIKTYGRGPGGCVPESKWKELADEGVAPQCSRSPSEWTLFYLHGTVGGEPGGGSGEWGGQRMGTRVGGRVGGTAGVGGERHRGEAEVEARQEGDMEGVVEEDPLILLPSPSSKSFPEWRAMHQTAEHCPRVVRDDLAVEMAEVEQGSGGGG
ncbi:unnamed protein product [Closterium sp. NIES-64]|nr:unnamed protein product [Closterium sp. NIES-64]